MDFSTAAQATRVALFEQRSRRLAASYNRCMRPRYRWQLRSRALELGQRTLVMGVVNVTPDSFSDGGEFLDPERAIEHALQMLDEGADILDIGGESTRPGARVAANEARIGNARPVVSEEEELRRVMPVIRAFCARGPDAVVSVDTYKSGVARAAVQRGRGDRQRRQRLSVGPADGRRLRRIAVRRGADAHPRPAARVAQSSARAGHHCRWWSTTSRTGCKSPSSAECDATRIVLDPGLRLRQELRGELSAAGAFRSVAPAGISAAGGNLAQVIRRTHASASAPAGMRRRPSVSMARWRRWLPASCAEPTSCVSMT